ncbi:hypothetical protein [Caballeronia sp. 15715]|uniref:hypothetical protein n=1 Tax=unclassified Caballeronia TaxID=2646786 RepID=UPI0039E229E2
MAYFLQRLGFGDTPFECYEHAEATFENALAVAAKSACWLISEQDAPVIERLLALHDSQLSEAPMHRVAEAENSYVNSRRYGRIAARPPEIGLMGPAALPMNAFTF